MGKRKNSKKSSNKNEGVSSVERRPAREREGEGEKEKTGNGVIRGEE
jgi:hypothetical protein